MTEQAGEPPDPWVLQHEFTSKRLNRLAAALEAQSYLEIGVHTGGTFARVQVPERTRGLPPRCRGRPADVC